MSLLYGLLIGSFLNVVIYRLPLGKSVVRPRSTCPQCGHQIHWYENIPVMSYIFLRGKCSNCHANIPLRYPLIELLIGAFFYARFPISLDAMFIYSYILEISLFCIFVSIFFIDLDHHIIPDSLNIILGIIFFSNAVIQDRIPVSLMGGAVAFAFTFGFTYLFYKLRGVIGLGGGDIKLFTALGLQLGVQGIIYNIFLSCFVGALVGLILLTLKKISSDRPFAFGPSIICVSTLQILFPQYFEMIIGLIIS